MKRHLVLIAIIAALQIGSVGAINYVIDPFLLHQKKHAGADGLSRVDQFTNVRLYKPYHVSRIQPDAIIIGTSRSGTIRPRHETWEGLTTFNLAVPGITPYELKRFVKHAQAVKPLTKLMIGIDFQAFITPLPRYRAGFEPDRQARTAGDFHSLSFNRRRLKDLQLTLFSLDVLGESLRATNPSASLPRRFFPDGTWKEMTNFLKGTPGYRYVAGNRLDVDFPSLNTRDNLILLRDILDFCYRNGIDTRLFFTPSHSVMVDLWFQLIPEKLWRDLHVKVLAANEELAGRYSAPPFPVWGFQTEREVVSEPIYRSREAHKAWFNDGIHYGFPLGERIMDAVWGDDPSFGRTLDSSNIGNYLDEVDAISGDFVESNESQVARLYARIGLAASTAP